MAAQQAPPSLGFSRQEASLELSPSVEVVWMWFGAFPGAFGLGRAEPQRRGTSPCPGSWADARWGGHVLGPLEKASAQPLVLLLKKGRGWGRHCPAPASAQLLPVCPARCPLASALAPLSAGFPMLPDFPVLALGQWERLGRRAHLQVSNSQVDIPVLAQDVLVAQNCPKMMEIGAKPAPRALSTSAVLCQQVTETPPANESKCP